MSYLEINKVSKKFGDANALDKITLSIDKRARIGIVGETGSGKSSLLKIIAGLESSDSGQVLFNGSRVKGPQEQLVAGHEHIAYLRQDYKLPKFKSVEDFLYDPYEISEKDAHEIYEACQISELIDRDTQALSGGEKQRVALAKLLMYQPQILLLDEPFSNLDYHNKSIVKNTLQVLSEKLELTILMVTHDSRDVLAWADELLVLKEGNIAQKGKPKALYYNPKNEYVAGLFGDYNLIKQSIFDKPTSKFTEVKDCYLLRPDHLKFVEDKSKSILSGKIAEINFMGNYYEIVVNAGEFYLVLIETHKKDKLSQKQINDLVHIGLNS